MTTFNTQSLLAGFGRVKENNGCAGVDGVTIARFERHLVDNIRCLEQELAFQTYLPLPLRQILVDKGNGEARALSVPAVRDRVVQSTALSVIEPILDREFEDCSFAYRKGRSVRQAVERIRQFYNDGFHWVVNADIDAFFDSVEHRLMREKVQHFIKDPELVRLIGLWLAAEIWDGKHLRQVERGIPQGSPVSPILANLFLDELDEALLAAGLRLVRFADDFIILCRTSEAAQKALAKTRDVLAELHLTLDEEEIISFDQGFKYLGVLFVKSLVMAPFDRPKKEHRVLHVAGTLDVVDYMRRRREGGLSYGPSLSD